MLQRAEAEAILPKAGAYGRIDLERPNSRVQTYKLALYGQVSPG